MTYGHVSLACVMQVMEVCPFVPVHQRQTMKPFHSVGGQSAAIRNIVLWP